MATITRRLGLGDGTYVDLEFDDVAMTFDGFYARNRSAQNLRIHCTDPVSWSAAVRADDPDLDREFSAIEKIPWEWVDVWDEDLGENVQVVGGFSLYATLGN